MRISLLSVYLLSWPLGLVSSVSTSLGATTDEIEMDVVLIDGNVPSKDKVWTRAQDISNFPIEQYEDLYYYANAHFNWVKKQEGCLTNNGNLLVASFYVPSEKTVYSSTIPRGKLSDKMATAELDGKVWVWLSRAQDPKFFTKVFYHVEDSAYYLYEQLLTNPLVTVDEDAPDDKEKLDLRLMDVSYVTYGIQQPDGPMIAVWGMFSTNSEAVKTARGRPVNLCSTDTTSRKSCSKVADSLGVYYERVTETVAQAQQNDNADSLVDQSAAATGDVCDPGPSRKRWEHREADDYYLPRQAPPSCSDVLISFAPITSNVLPTETPTSVIIATTSATTTTTSVTTETTVSTTTTPEMTSTEMLSPTHKVLLQDSSLNIGNLDDPNGGAQLRSDVFDKLRALCPDDGTSCDFQTPVKMEDVPTVVGEDVAYFDLQFTIKGSNYTDADTRDRLLALAVSAWERAANKTCKLVSYKSEADPTASGCGSGPIQQRSLPPRSELEKRRAELDERICGTCDILPPEECTYDVNICTTPDLITSIYGSDDDPYSNYIEIELELVKGDNNPVLEWLCELAVDALSAAAIVVAPELAQWEIFEGTIACWRRCWIRLFQPV
ncbi:hypothetical protein GGR55DRAFT_115235 [Xylaria sp. FL0064]|nr:hypothetical protein GGR55DRAFT_115235 [Xylaria sp. FL0064]